MKEKYSNCSMEIEKSKEALRERIKDLEKESEIKDKKIEHLENLVRIMANYMEEVTTEAGNYAAELEEMLKEH